MRPFIFFVSLMAGGALAAMAAAQVGPGGSPTEPPVVVPSD